jgi:hypothetical protein
MRLDYLIETATGCLICETRILPLTSGDALSALAFSL